MSPSAAPATKKIGSRMVLRRVVSRRIGPSGPTRRIRCDDNIRPSQALRDHNRRGGQSSGHGGPHDGECTPRTPPDASLPACGKAPPSATSMGGAPDTSPTVGPLFIRPLRVASPAWWPTCRTQADDFLAPSAPISTARARSRPRLSTASAMVRCGSPSLATTECLWARVSN